MRNQHVWHDKTPEGERREVRATKFAGRWQLRAKVARQAGWTDLDPPPVSDLETLRDVLWRKYQRKRLPYEDVVAVDRLIQRYRPRVPGGLPAAGETVAGEAGPGAAADSASRERNDDDDDDDNVRE